MGWQEAAATPVAGECRERGWTFARSSDVSIFSGFSEHGEVQCRQNSTEGAGWRQPGKDDWNRRGPMEAMHTPAARGRLKTCRTPTFELLWLRAETRWPWTSTFHASHLRASHLNPDFEQNQKPFCRPFGESVTLMPTPPPTGLATEHPQKS